MAPAGKARLAGSAVPAGHWQGARLIAETHGYALLGCTVTPPWTPEGFELGARERLTAEGSMVVGDSSEEFTAFVKSEIARWGKVVKEAAIRAD